MTSPMPLPTTNPVLDEVDQHLGAMTPPARNAVMGAMSRLQPQAQPVASGATATPTPTPMQPPSKVPEIHTPSPSTPSDSTMQQIGMKPPPMAAPPQRGTLAGDEANLSRLGSTGSGITQIQNPWLKALATRGDVAASGFFPRAAMMIPGTEAHHGLLVNQAQGAVNADEAQASAESKRQEEEAQTQETQARSEALRRPPQDEFSTVPTDTGYVNVSKKTGT